eukprot:scaffold9791_cov108-Isochrysis_galbana.AAC.2
MVAAGMVKAETVVTKIEEGPMVAEADAMVVVAREVAGTAAAATVPGVTEAAAMVETVTAEAETEEVATAAA